MTSMGNTEHRQVALNPDTTSHLALLLAVLIQPGQANQKLLVRCHRVGKSRRANNL